ncbi:MAG: tyrosine-type recombinase/integrase [Eubacterium sp.]|nr:tyrosine-type recombinase/integrase [Eubacterium sp.]
MGNNIGNLFINTSKHDSEVMLDQYIGEPIKTKTCEYKGVTYFVSTDFETGKEFIEVDGQRKYLDKNGVVANKQPNTRNVKDCIDSYEDMCKVYNYLLEQKRWNIYLLFVMNYNLNRRVGDLLNTTWKDFFDENWKIRKFWQFKEGKTKKDNELKINKAIKIAFKIFFENETAFEKTEKNYYEPIFKQLHGTHKRKVISQEGYRQALIKAGNDLGLEKRLRSHGFRRGAFTNMIESHPNDPKAKTIVMDISKHSSEQMLTHYIGESDKNKEKYLDDLGKDFEKYVINGEEVPFHKKVPQVVCNTTRLMESMRDAASYFMVKGMEMANETDPKVILQVVNDSMKKLEEMLEDIAD